MPSSIHPLSLFAHCVAIIFSGLLIGALAVIFPPMAAFGVVGLIALLMFWTLPQLHRVPEKALRAMFFVLIFTQICVPAYYMVQVPGLPWLSARRIVTFVVVILFLINIAGSRSARSKIITTLASIKLSCICIFGFAVMLFLSIFTSSYYSESVSYFSDSLLNWYVPFFVALLVIQSEEDIWQVIKFVTILAIVVGLAGLIEFILQHRFLFDIFPRSVLAAMMAGNPAIAAMVNSSPFRNGLYRASSTFTVPLSFGEFAAIVAPFCAYFVLHGKTWCERALGVAAMMSTMLALFISGARGGYVSFLIAMPLLMSLWTVRHSRLNPRSLSAAICLIIILIGTVATVALLVYWPRFGNLVLGGGEAASQYTVTIHSVGVGKASYSLEFHHWARRRHGCGCYWILYRCSYTLSRQLRSDFTCRNGCSRVVVFLWHNCLRSLGYPEDFPDRRRQKLGARRSSGV